MFDMQVYSTNELFTGLAVLCWPTDMENDIAYAAVFDEETGNVTSESID